MSLVANINCIGCKLFLDSTTFKYDKTPEVYGAVFIGPWVADFGLMLSNRFNTRQALSSNKDALQFKTLSILSLIYPLLEE